MSQLIETRSDFQKLADDRLAEAKTLLAAAKWDGAYYLAGYAVELALKSCIIKRLMATDAFPEKKFSDNCYTHVIENLVKLAGLDELRKIATDANPQLNAYWDVVRDWSEQKRYHRISQTEANELYNAIADASHGVLPWIKSQW